MKEKLKILILDKENLVHTELKSFLKAYWKNTKFLVKTHADGMPEETPYLIIIGTNAGNKLSVTGLIKKLMRKFPSSRILIFSTVNEWDYAEPWLKAGARGYLSQHADEKTMISAVDTVLEGKHLFCDDKLKEQLYHDFFLSYLNGNHRKTFVSKEGLVGYKKKQEGLIPNKKVIYNKIHHF